MSSVQKVKHNEDSKLINEILEQDGCIVIEDVIPASNVELLKQELKPHFAQTSNCNGDFYGRATKRLGSLIAKSSQCQYIAIHPSILSVMDEFLLRGCTEYQLNLTQGIRIGQNEPQQMMHPDDPMFPFFHPGYEAMINCMWAVDDFTEENGATHIVPGSHKWERTQLVPSRVPKPDEIVQGCMSSGSVLIYFGSLLHCGGSNKTSQPRTGVVMSYNLGWLRQSENQYLAVPIECAKKLPHKLQRLLGYFVHKPNLGQIEGRDPIELLQGRDVVNAGFEEFIPEEVKPMLQQHLAEQLKNRALLNK